MVKSVILMNAYGYLKRITPIYRWNNFMIDIIIDISVVLSNKHRYIDLLPVAQILCSTDKE